MIICKRCGSITLNGTCINCSSSNLFSHNPTRMPIRLGSDFFNPTAEIENKLNWKTQLEDKEDIIPKIQSPTTENKGITRNHENIFVQETENKDVLFDIKNQTPKKDEVEIVKDRNPVNDLLNFYPFIKRRMDWHNQIKKNTSVKSDLKKHNLPPQIELEEKPKKLKPKLNKDTEIYQFND